MLFQDRIAHSTPPSPNLMFLVCSRLAVSLSATNVSISSVLRYHDGFALDEASFCFTRGLLFLAQEAAFQDTVASIRHLVFSSFTSIDYRYLITFAMWQPSNDAQ